MTIYSFVCLHLFAGVKHIFVTWGALNTLYNFVYIFVYVYICVFPKVDTYLSHESEHWISYTILYAFLYILYMCVCTSETHRCHMRAGADYLWQEAAWRLPNPLYTFLIKLNIPQIGVTLAHNPPRQFPYKSEYTLNWDNFTLHFPETYLQCSALALVPNPTLHFH